VLSVSLPGGWVIDDPLSARKTAAAMVALFSQLQLASLEKLQ